MLIDFPPPWTQLLPIPIYLSPGSSVLSFVVLGHLFPGKRLFQAPIQAPIKAPKQAPKWVLSTCGLSLLFVFLSHCDSFTCQT